jgi:hypothetical protein
MAVHKLKREWRGTDRQRLKCLQRGLYQIRDMDKRAAENAQKPNQQVHYFVEVTGDPNDLAMIQLTNRILELLGQRS